MLSRLPAPAADVLALVARLLLGVVLLAHGTGKLADLGGTAAGFAAMGVPLAGAGAGLAAAVELGGGLLILAGLLTPFAGVAVALLMLGAGWFAGHWTGGVTGADGWELVGAIATGALLLAAFGPGRFSVDHVLARRRGAVTRG